jgi:hypothetical protein
MPGRNIQAQLHLYSLEHMALTVSNFGALGMAVCDAGDFGEGAHRSQRQASHLRKPRIKTLWNRH